MDYYLLLLQIISHILSDYFFQTHKNAIEKNEKGFKSDFIIKHILSPFNFSNF